MNFLNTIKELLQKKVAEKQAQKQESNSIVDTYTAQLVNNDAFKEEVKQHPFFANAPLHERDVFEAIIRLMTNYFSLSNKDISYDTRFEDISVGSLERCELLILLEKKYNIDLEKVYLEPEDSIQKLCDIIGNTVSEKYGSKYILTDDHKHQKFKLKTPKKGQKMIELLPNTYKTKPESVFYNVKQILLVQKHNKAIDLTPEMNMVSDLHISGQKLLVLVKELEKRYNKTIVSHKQILSAKTLRDFCAIFANDLNTEKTELKSRYQGHIAQMTAALTARVK